MGDTALVASAHDIGDSPGWLRWVTLSDGLVLDSLAVRQGNGPGLYAQVFPDRRHLMIASTGPAGRTVTVTDRAGRVIDSLPIRVARVSEVFLTPDGSAILLMAPREHTPAQFDMLRYRVDSSGHVGQPDTVARQLPSSAGIDLAPNGMLVYGSGPMEYSVWALRRDSPANMRFTQRRLAVRAGMLFGTVSPGGDRVLISRQGGAGLGRRTQLSVMSFDSGPETPLGEPEDVADWDWSQDGKFALAATRRGGDSVDFLQADAGTGRMQVVATLAKSEYLLMETLPGGGFLILPPSGHAFRRVGVAGLPDTTFRLPAETGTIYSIDPSPNELAFVALARNATGDSVLVTRISLTDGRVTRLASLPGEHPQSPRWQTDGSISVPVVDNAWTMTWYRLPATGGIPVRLGSPPLFPATYRVSRDGLRVIARVQGIRGDIYLIRDFGKMLR